MDAHQEFEVKAVEARLHPQITQMSQMR